MPKITVATADLEALSGYMGLNLERIAELVKLAKGELHPRHSTADELRIELQDTNRPDTWCVEGIARLLKSHRDGCAQDYPIFNPGGLPAGTIDVDGSVEQVRPYVAAFISKGYTVDEVGLKAFISAQEVLSRNYGRMRKTVAIGIYDCSAITFPVRYEAADAASDARAFVPLPPTQASSEDAGPVKDGDGNAIPRERWEQPWTPAQILRDHPTGREYAAALKDPSRAPILVDAKDRVLSFPPIINSASLGRVSEGMSELFVEVTGDDIDQVLLATNILAANLHDRGAQVLPVLTQYPFDTPRGREVQAPHPLTDKRTVTVPVDEFGRLLGLELAADEVMARLHAFGLSVKQVSTLKLGSGDGDKPGLRVTAPAYRADYLHAVDAIEDCAISHGFDAFEPLMPESFTVGALAPETAFADLARDLAIGCGFDEAIGNLLTSAPELRERMCVSEESELGPLHGGPLVRIKNVMNLNYSVLRDWLLPTLLEVASNSSGALFPHRVFEVGEVCGWAPSENLKSRTEWRLCALMSDHELGFSSIQAYMHEMLRTLGVSHEISPLHELEKASGPARPAYVLKPGEHPSFISGRTAWIVVGGQQVGVIGEVHPQVLTNWKVHAPCGAFELRLEPLRALLT